MTEPVFELVAEGPVADASPPRRDGQAATLVKLVDGAITETLQAPTGPGWDNNAFRWIDWGDQATFDSWCAEFGWTVVAETPEPDAGNQIAASTVELLDGVPTRVWSLRDKTPAEIDAELSAQAAMEREVAIQNSLQGLPALVEAVDILILDALGGI